MSASPLPVVSLSGARAAYVGPGLALSPHRNAAATLAVALDAPFRLAIAGQGASSKILPADTVTSCIALIPPRTLHHVRAAGPMVFIYLDALGDDHAALAATELGAARARLLAQGAERVAALDVDGLCDALGVPSGTVCDDRIVRVVRCMDGRPQDLQRVADAARLACLSASRFQAVFREAVGVPFRRYRLWRRMAAVARVIADGRSLTHAAHEAGFASSAHLSTAFRAMFGLAPSRLLAAGAVIREVDASSAAAVRSSTNGS